MAKKASAKAFVCDACGYDSSKWLGQCPACGQWNTFKEIALGSGPATKASRPVSDAVPSPTIALKDVTAQDAVRISTGSDEVDRILGGGLVPGTFFLLAGDPGIGKSTLLLHVAATLATQQHVLYVCGEESPAQIRLRAERMGLAESDLQLCQDTEPERIVSRAQTDNAQVIIIDSIQTLFHPDSSGLPGSVTQIREAAVRLMKLAKEQGRTVGVIGHVTKSGEAAGPRVLEHMVDAVLMLEAGAGGSVRLLRGMKNRFGRTDELGFLEMTQRGLRDLPDGASLLVDLDAPPLAGSAVAVAFEGHKSWLVEVQALVVPSAYSMPKRSADGIDLNRMQRLVAVAERGLALPLSHHDVYVNVTGGFDIADPSLDLALCAAIYSSVHDQPAPRRSAFLGEVGLSGEVRRVPHLDHRLREAARLGIERVWVGAPPKGTELDTTLKVTQLSRIGDLARRQPDG